MTSHASSYRRGLAVAAVAMLGLGVAGSQSPAFARVSDAMTSSAAKVSLPAPLAQRGSTPNSAIVVADNRDNDHGNWNGKKGKGDGNRNSQGNNGNWNGNKSGNWNGNKSGTETGTATKTETGTKAATTATTGTRAATSAGATTTTGTTTGTRAGTIAPMCAGGQTGPITASSSAGSCLDRFWPRPAPASCPIRPTPSCAGTGPIPTCIAAIGTIATETRPRPHNIIQGAGRKAGAFSIVA